MVMTVTSHPWDDGATLSVRGQMHALCNARLPPLVVADGCSLPFVGRFVDTVSVPDKACMDSG